MHQPRPTRQPVSPVHAGGPLLFVLLLALVFRAAIPLGFMPETDQGTIRLVMCGDGNAVEHVLLDTQPDEPELQAPCEFGVIASMAVLPSSGTTPAADLLPVSGESSTARVAPRARPTEFRLARGPPSIS